MQNAILDFKENMKYGLKWIMISLLLGSICGVVGAVFHHAIDAATELREMNHFLVYLMPLGGLFIVFLYNVVGLKNQPGTNTIINSVRQQDSVPKILAPAIFVGTVITHLVGGSSGREGAALQIGGSIATTLGNLLKIDEKDMSILIMCGMTAVFSALFGTPITATIFSMEVVSVGIFYYSALVPCLCSSLVAFFTAKLFGCSSVIYTLKDILVIDVQSFISLIGLAICIAIVSILFVMLMHKTHHLFNDTFKNSYLRVVIGSIILIILVLIFGHDYLGAGMHVVDQAIYGQVNPYDFILKAIFTAITIGCGFKGGEIVPTFFIGATLGATIGPLLGLDPSVCAALGMVGMFSCVVNSPITSIILGIEIFGNQNLLPFTIIVAFCYIFSGYFSLYHAQKFVYSKTKAEFINKDAI